MVEQRETAAHMRMAVRFGRICVRHGWSPSCFKHGCWSRLPLEQPPAAASGEHAVGQRVADDAALGLADALRPLHAIDLAEDQQGLHGFGDLLRPIGFPEPSVGDHAGVRIVQEHERRKRGPAGRRVAVPGEQAHEQGRPEVPTEEPEAGPEERVNTALVALRQVAQSLRPVDAVARGPPRIRVRLLRVVRDCRIASAS